MSFDKKKTAIVIYPPDSPRHGDYFDDYDEDDFYYERYWATGKLCSCTLWSVLTTAGFSRWNRPAIVLLAPFLSDAQDSDLMKVRDIVSSMEAFRVRLLPAKNVTKEGRPHEVGVYMDAESDVCHSCGPPLISSEKTP